jgi:integrase
VKDIKLSGMTITVKYLHLNHGLYWYKRRIPKALASHFPGRHHHSKSLATSDLSEATKRALAETQKLDEIFKTLRDPRQASTPLPSLISLLSARYGDPEDEPPIPELQPQILLGEELDARLVAKISLEGEARGYEGEHLKDWIQQEYWSRNQSANVASLASASELAFLSKGTGKIFLTLGTLKTNYLDLALKRSGASASRVKSTNDTFKSFADFVGGEKTLVSTIEAKHVQRWVERVVSSGCKPSTAERRLKQLKAAFNLVLESEGGHFSKVFIPGLADHDGRRYCPTFSQGRQMLETFRDDPVFVLIVLLGGRISEIAGLRMSDVFLEEAIPFLRIVDHPGRSLKTSSSNRDVPLVGAALTAVRSITNSISSEDYLLPRYGQRKTGGEMLSADFNLKSKSLDPKITSHSFRHLLKDLLREAGAPEGLANEIQGHATEGHAAKYGRGYSMRLKAEWLQKAYFLIGAHSCSLSEIEGS